MPSDVALVTVYRTLYLAIGRSFRFSLLQLLTQQPANFVGKPQQLRRILLIRGPFAQLLP